ncbi:PREDICTED: uncharacterized protein LOC108773209 [Cyphomyrmex costatus]|uniref:uncharacterized protein LOC108773209 n=1 Tax=Cyphomyrmex costatus TaxID=456900 RepID=UPI000852430C|nr:PREDICTED: uncharacterized protein LOC108773209 [Cyphomyrmex costatus]
MLKCEFAKNEYPSTDKVEKIANKLGVSYQKIYKKIHSVKSDYKKVVKRNPPQIESHSVIHKRYTDNELNKIRRVFEETPYPTENKVQELVQKTGIPINSINEIFQNLRQENNKMNKPTISSTSDHQI